MKRNERMNHLFSTLAFVVLLTPFVAAFPSCAHAQDVTQGATISGELPGCQDKVSAMKLATILADEGEEKAGKFLDDPETPCGDTIPLAEWIVMDEVYVLQGKDKQWIRVIELRGANAGVSFFWVTYTEMKRNSKGRNV